VTSYTLTSAPRSTVTHVHDLSTTLGHLTACGRRIGDNWSGEYDEGLPDGMPTCKGCLRHLDKSVARPFRSRVGDVPAGHVPVDEWDDGAVCPCSAYPEPHPVHCEECSARQDECVCADEATEWRNLRGVRVATARRHLRDATLYRQHGARDEWALSMGRAAAARRNGWHASILLGQVES
jgi:hypothetical protein